MKVKTGIITLSITCLFCAGIGGIIGWFVGNYFKPTKTFVGQYEQDTTAHTNFDEFLSKVGKSESELNTIDFTDKNILNQVSIGDIIGYAQYLYCYNNEYTNYIACSRAISGSFNTQTVISEYIQNGNLRSRENVCYSSSGLVSFGEIAYNFDSTSNINSLTQPYDGGYDYYRCKSDVTYNETTKDITAVYDGRYKWKTETIIEKVSFIPDFPFGYNINVNTLENSSWHTKFANGEDITFDNRVELVGENYEFYLNLNTVATETLAMYSSLSTRDQNNLAKMKKPPQYNHCGVKITTTKDLKIVNLKACEDYKVFTTLADTGTQGYCNIIYSYNKKELHKPNGNTINYKFAEDGLYEKF